MTPRAKLALGGIAVLGGLAAYFASTSTAKASSVGPGAPSGGTARAPWPSDNMPWMAYSATTQQRQRAYNEEVRLANTGDDLNDPMFSQPYLKEDGILGPLSCEAFVYWETWGGPIVPLDCR
jgi:hypothetical protein